MCQKGRQYINYMEDLNKKFGSILSCRLEQVALFNGDFHHVMDAESTFKEEALSGLLSSRAMVVPFLDYKHEPGLLSVITQVVNHLTVKLRGLLDQNDGMGGAHINMRWLWRSSFLVTHCLILISSYLLAWGPALNSASAGLTTPLSN